MVPLKSPLKYANKTFIKKKQNIKIKTHKDTENESSNNSKKLRKLERRWINKQ